MVFTRPLAQASRNSAFEMSPLPSLSTCVKLTMNGAAADLANKSPDGTALFQIASHCSGFRAAEGRPDVMVFACASAQVTVNGRRTMEMMDALNMCLLLVLASDRSRRVNSLCRVSVAASRWLAMRRASFWRQHRGCLETAAAPSPWATCPLRLGLDAYPSP